MGSLNLKLLVECSSEVRVLIILMEENWEHWRLEIEEEHLGRVFIGSLSLDHLMEENWEHWRVKIEEALSI